MSEWQPGKPVKTRDDATAWRTWIKARKLEQQRERRAKLRRIDYYPSREALEVILDACNNGYGGDFASVINRIIEEWAEFPEFQLPEHFSGKKR
ncbi:MAG: hypothetical protein WBN82_05335 [Porticoccaceae bacterium]